MNCSEKTTLLVVGGCRSGKSGFAESWAEGRSRRPLYVATMVSGGDRELAGRIARHRADRSDCWRTIEEPVQLAALLREPPNDCDLVLVDCLTLWLTNLLLNELSDKTILARVDDLGLAVASCPVSVVLVANEVGLGIVPDSSLARRFRDLAGWCNQRLAARCETVVMMVAGLPLHAKGADVARKETS